MTLTELGRSIYGTVCSACHGFEKANNPAAPAFATLKSVKERLTQQQVLDLLATGRNQMPSFATFSALERRAVAALFDQGATKRSTCASSNLVGAMTFHSLPPAITTFATPTAFPSTSGPGEH
ncbi:MAG: cytochrome c [Verrucomicrobiota bacterium]